MSLTLRLRLVVTELEIQPLELAKLLEHLDAPRLRHAVDPHHRPERLVPKADEPSHRPGNDLRE
jgi:hypothetical protein